MERVAAQRWIIFLNFQLFRLKLFVASGGVARWRFPFLSRFGAFDSDDFPHGLFLFLWLFLRLVAFFLDFVDSDSIDGTERAKSALAQGAFAFQLRLRLNGE